MRFLLYFFLLLFFSSCSSTKTAYWCGDHTCKSKKEKEEYFKKTMIVETKYNDIDDNKKDSKIDIILNQAKNNTLANKEEKIFKNDNLIEKKRKKKEEKMLAKELKREEKKRLEEEETLAKLIEKDERKSAKEEKAKLKKEKRLTKKTKVKEKKEFKTEDKYTGEEVKYNNFDKVVKKIIKDSDDKSYPDINNIDY